MDTQTLINPQQLAEELDKTFSQNQKPTMSVDEIFSELLKLPNEEITSLLGGKGPQSLQDPLLRHELGRILTSKTQPLPIPKTTISGNDGSQLQPNNPIPREAFLPPSSVEQPPDYYQIYSEQTQQQSAGPSIGIGDIQNLVSLTKGAGAPIAEAGVVTGGSTTAIAGGQIAAATGVGAAGTGAVAGGAAAATNIAGGAFAATTAPFWITVGIVALIVGLMFLTIMNSSGASMATTDSHSGTGSAKNIPGFCWPVTGGISDTPYGHDHRPCADGSGDNCSGNFFGSAGDSLDISVNEFSNLYAPFSGNFIYFDDRTGIFNTGLGGNYILLTNDEYGITAIFAHLAPQPTNLPRQGRVARGDIIGITDNSGTNTTGPHLHYEVRGVAMADIAPTSFELNEVINSGSCTSGTEEVSPPATTP